MKILFSHYLLDDDNPPVRTVSAISNELRALGHEVLIHRCQGAIQAQHHGKASGGRAGGWKRWVKSKAWFAKAVARNATMYRNDLRAIRAVAPDIVLARQDAYWLSMSLAAHRTGRPLVVYADAPVAYEVRTYHAKERWHPPGLLEAFERWGLAPSTAVIATSHPTAEKIGEYKLGLTTRVVPNGLHPERFPEFSEHVRRHRRHELGIDASRVIGFQGTFKPFHGLDRLKELILATGSDEDVHWLLIGDGPLRKEVEAAVAGRAKVTFLGRQPPEIMGSLLALVDVAVAPHDFTPGIFYLSPLKIIEAAAAGCVVVASRQGDIPWLLDDGRAGILLDDPDVSVWADAIDRVLRDPESMRSLGQAARRRVLANFSWRRIAEQYESVLSWTLNGGKASAVPLPETARAPAAGI
jgi:glycosyltransferase involved in cell wall biosynthesis